MSSLAQRAHSGAQLFQLKKKEKKIILLLFKLDLLFLETIKCSDWGPTLYKLMQPRRVIKFCNLIKAFNGIDHFKEFSGYWDFLTKESLLDYYCSVPVAVCFQMPCKPSHCRTLIFSVEDGTNVQFPKKVSSSAVVFSFGLLATSSIIFS